MTSDHPPLSFDEFLGGVSQLGSARGEVPEDRRTLIEQAAEAIEELPSVDRESLEELVRERPDWVPVLALAVGLSQEQLKNQLKAATGTSGWIRLAREHPDLVIDVLDSEELQLLNQLRTQRGASYRWADVLIARASGQSRAGRAIERGRDLEDKVEDLARSLDLTYDVRTRFVGRGDRDAPCDLAIPGGGQDALIAIAVKGFDSTGSKLTDAVREVEQIAAVRQPRQFVFAVVDGIGWLNRQSDLRRLYALWAERQIDGLYTLARFEEFESDLREAVVRLGLI